MRVVFLANPRCVHTVRWAEALMERGWEIQVLTVQATPSPPAKFQVWKLPFGRPWGYVANVPFVRKLLRQLRPDLLHTHYASGYGTLARLADYRPSVLSVWGSDVFLFPEKSRFHRSTLQKNLGHADLVCSTGHVMARRTKQLCEDIKQLEVTPFGVDVGQFFPDSKSGDSDEIVVGTVKTLEWNYGIDVLIRAFAVARIRVASIDPNAVRRMRLLIVGGGSQRVYLESLARQCGISEVANFMGPIPHRQVPANLNKIDVYCALSRSESFGVAVLEASACGVPVVVSDVGGLPEVVVNEVTGLVVEGENVAATAESIAELVLDPARRSTMGQSGRKHVVQNYDWRDSVDKMEAIYRKTLRVPQRNAA